MVNKGALKAGLLIGGGLLAVLVLGQVVTYVTRILARAIANVLLVALAVGLAYGAYQVYSGWLRGEAETRATEPDQRDIGVTKSATDLEDVEKRYVEGDLDEREMERELESVMQDDGDSDLELEYD